VICSIAGKFGVSGETLRNWVRQAEVDGGRCPGTTTDESAELKRLRRENAELKMRWYVRGLLSEVERRTGGTLAEAAGDAGPEGMQRLLNFYAWDTDGLRDDMAGSSVLVVVDPIDDAGGLAALGRAVHGRVRARGMTTGSAPGTTVLEIPPQ
jgi:hypothetical protein